MHALLISFLFLQVTVIHKINPRKNFPDIVLMKKTVFKFSHEYQSSPCNNHFFTGTLRSKTTSIDNLHGSVDSLGDSTLYYQTGEDPTLTELNRPSEEEFVVELHRDGSHKLGLSIVGGADNSRLETVHVSVCVCCLLICCLFTMYDVLVVAEMYMYTDFLPFK